MSRHRFVTGRNLDTYDYDDDDPIRSPMDAAASPGSEAQFLYRDNKGFGGFGNFLSRAAPGVSALDKAEDDDNYEDDDKYHDDPKGGDRGDSMFQLEPELEEEPRSKEEICIAGVRAVVGEAATREEIRRVGLANQWDVGRTIQHILDAADRRGGAVAARLPPGLPVGMPPSAKKPTTTTIATPKKPIPGAGATPKRVAPSPVLKRAPAPAPAAPKGAGAKAPKPRVVLPTEQDAADSDIAAMGFGGATTGETGDGTRTRTSSGGEADLERRLSDDDDRSAESKPTTPDSSRADATPRMSDAKRSKLGKTIEKEIEAARATGGGKESLNLVVVGHVDAGKSTLMGHLLYKLGAVTSQAMHKFERDSARQGKKSFMFAWVLDAHEEERARGITMDVAVTNFDTGTKHITLLDAPGHRDFIPNMISGAAQADAAVLVVSTQRGEFEAGFDADGQTKEHTLLLRSLGVRQLVVAVNKLDTVDWSVGRYEEVVGKLRAFLQQVGFRNAEFIPCAGMVGENLTESKEPLLQSWYSGPTLMQAIDSFSPAERDVDGPLRMSVADSFKSQTLGSITVAGKIETGTLKLDDRVMLMPSKELCLVRGLENMEGPVRWAQAGDNVSVGLSGVEIQSLSSARFICLPQNPIRIVSKFVAQVLVMEGVMPITKGAQVVLHYQAFSEPAVLSKLLSVRNRATGDVEKKKPRRLAGGETAEVEVITERPVCLEVYSECKALGRVMIREGGKTIACGIVTQTL